MKKYLLFLLAITVFARAEAFEINEDIHGFAANMESCYGVPAKKVEWWLYGTDIKELALNRTAKPTEAKPWGEYRKLFITDDRIRGGLDFYLANEDDLVRAERQFGVSRYVIAAILGVETNYGKYQLKLRAADMLATLAFNSPNRSAFFTKELQWLFIIADREDVDPLTYMGSYAGAIGYPQFMPSNFDKFGVDFDGDGKTDLVRSMPDAIGSVAKYLSAHRYSFGDPIAVQADVSGDTWQTYDARSMRPSKPLKELMDNGITPRGSFDPNMKATLYTLDGSDGKEYWVFFNNLYAISRYNPRVNYAMAVFSLSQELEKAINWANEEGVYAE